MRVSKSILESLAGQRIGVDRHAVRIVNVAGLENPEPSGLGGLDGALEARLSKFTVANERDALDAGLGAFLDLEDKIDASTAGNRLGRALHLVTAGSAIDACDPRHLLS